MRPPAVPFLRELRIRAIAGVFAALFSLCALAFLLFAGYLVLLDYLDPRWAALATGSACLLVAGLILVSARRLVRRDSTREPAGQDNPADAIEGLLQSAVDDALVGAWIRRYPDAAAGASLLLGVAAGYSGAVRRVLQEIWTQRTEDGRGGSRR